MKNTNSLLCLCVIGMLTIPLVLSQQTKFLNCASKDKCDECIRTYGCAWCSDPTFKDARCSKASDSKCAANFIMNPTIEMTEVISIPLSNVTKGGSSGFGDGSFTSTNTFISSSQENIVQVAPQVMRLKMRPNEGHPYKFKMWYKQAQDNPVDLYYLMDLSFSMVDDKEKLSKLGGDLASTMSNITRNFRLGFGSFVDKVVMPYVSIVPNSLKSPCQGCEAPYGYRHVMPLSHDTSTFSEKVDKAVVSGNLDAPEGGFDAIMQAIVCRDKIGWRDDARKLLVFSTDSSFHYAGDGKLGGIIKPNDGCCHLDDNGFYTHSELQDYPSVSQINLKVKEHSINVIFAVTQEVLDVYTLLSKHIEGSYPGVLSSNSENVVQLVKEQYEKITSTVELREKDLGNDMRVKYFSKCLNQNGVPVQTNKCDGLKVGQMVEFDVELELLSCPPDRKDWIRQFHIYPVGMRENLTVEVHLQCDCACQHPGHPSYEVDSPKCSNHGTLKCGICECEPGFSGEDCSCTSDADKTDLCHPNTTTQLCSGRGTCKCNKCYCDSFSATEVFYGDYCQCNNFSCPRIGGKMCSGRGECDCGRCKCNDGWSGEDCSCENNITNCLTGPNEVCSGHGTCLCNKCVCDQQGGYTGKYCDRCPQCSNKCPELRDCVQCKVHDSGPLSSPKELCDGCNITIEIVEFLNYNEDNYFCSYYDDKDCRYTYIYEVRGKEIHVTAQQNKECPPQARILGVVFGLILTIVLIGLGFLLMWKFITSMKDSREFAKFEKERMMAKWDTGQNPIYKQATSTFKNPTYCGS